MSGNYYWHLKDYFGIEKIVFKENKVKVVVILDYLGYFYIFNVTTD